MEIINFNKLDKSMYEGYYWYSNAETPFFNDFKNLSQNELPFVTEGYLYNNSLKHSISIKYFNGKYLIYEFKLTEIEQNSEYNLLNEKNFPMLNSGIYKNIIIRELQKKIFDNDFYTWTKVANIFTGFKK